MNLQLNWQDLAALAVITWAIWYVSRRLIGVVRRNPVTGCGTCPGCADKSNRLSNPVTSFVPIENLIASSPKSSPDN